MAKRDLTGRIIGAVVFLAGIAILVFVFILAYGFFTAPGGGIQIAQGPGNTSATNQLGAAATRMFFQLALMIIMAIVGSLIAARGIQFYFGTTAHDIARVFHRTKEIHSDEE